MKKIYLLICFLFLVSCTKGSLGNSLSERAIVLNKLFQIHDSEQVFSMSEFHFIDDQGDSNLLSFELISLNKDLIKLEIFPESYLKIGKIEYYLETPATPLSVQESPKHIEDPVTGQGSNPAQFFGSEFSEIINFSSLEKFQDGLNPSLLHRVQRNVKMSRGRITKFRISIDDLFLKGKVTSSSKSIEFQGNILNLSKTVSLNCPTGHSILTPSKILWQWNLIETWRENQTNSTYSWIYNFEDKAQVNLSGTIVEQNLRANFNGNSVFKQKDCK